MNQLIFFCGSSNPCITGSITVFDIYLLDFDKYISTYLIFLNQLPFDKKFGQMPIYIRSDTMKPK